MEVRTWFAALLARFRISAYASALMPMLSQSLHSARAASAWSALYSDDDDGGGCDRDVEYDAGSGDPPSGVPCCGEYSGEENGDQGGESKETMSTPLFMRTNMYECHRLSVGSRYLT